MLLRKWLVWGEIRISVIRGIGLASVSFNGEVECVSHDIGAAGEFSGNLSTAVTCGRPWLDEKGGNFPATNFESWWGVLL